MTKYQLARHKAITIIAIILEINMVFVCILLGDALAQQVFNIQTLLANHVSIPLFIVGFLLLQYGIVVVERMARFRRNADGFTLPLAFLPGGIIVRTVIILALEFIVIFFKLIVYFVSVLYEFVFQILHIHKFIGTSKFVDTTDFILEPLEIGVNYIYNFLYYHKIQPRTSVFNAFFNSTLSFWCINH